MWVLSEQIRRIEVMTKLRDEAVGASTTKALPAKAHEGTIRDARTSLLEDDGVDASKLEAGDLVANGTIQLLAPIGQGGQATIWQGRLTRTGELVAVRFLHEALNEHPEIVRSFKREGDTIRALSGDATAHLIQPVTFEDGRYFYVVDYLANAISFTQITQSSEVPVRRKLEMLCEVADALYEIHKQGYIHGDVKPENVIIVGPDGHVRLVDLGSAHRIGSQDDDEPITFTYAYAAPELLMLKDTLRGTSQSSRAKVGRDMQFEPSVDVYSLGIMLFHALDPGLGRIGRMEEFWLLDQLMVTDDLKAIIRTAIAREPAHRFKSALEFKLALEAAIKIPLQEPLIFLGYRKSGKT
jgi:serine/threonine protein kinase